MRDAIEWMEHVAGENSSRDFIVDAVGTEGAISYGAFRDSACATAAQLFGMGLSKGDSLLLLLNNSPSFAKLYFACIYSGIVAVPLNPMLGLKDIEFIARSSGAKTLVFSPETAGLCGGILNSGAFKALRLLDGRKEPDKPLEGVADWGIRGLKGDGGFKPFSGLSPYDTIATVYTSGTTATPQGVMHSIGSMTDNARSFNKRLGIGRDNRFYGMLSMSYLGGCYNLLLLPFAAGASVVVSSAFDPRHALSFWEDASKSRINTLWLVPTIISVLMEIDRGMLGEEYCRESVRLALVGTAPLPVRLRRSFETRYGIALHENYGLSETLFISTGSPSMPASDGSVGRPLPEMELSIVSPDGNPLGAGQEGEICVSSPHLMKGCHGAAPFDRGAPFATGDIGFMSASGELFITGRKKDLIIRGGINISPAAIEDVILRHPSVAECAVVGIPSAIYGEDVAAVVRLSQGASFDTVKPELAASFKASLGSFNRPATLLEIESFPKTPSGKIQKSRLRGLLIERLKLSGVAESQRTFKPHGSPSLPSITVRDIIRPAKGLAERLSKFPSTTISNALNGLCAMPPAMHPLTAAAKLCGCAVTVEEPDAGVSTSLAALELLKEGDVLVIDGKGVLSRPSFGASVAKVAADRGAAGIIVFGAACELDGICASGIPVHALGVSMGRLAEGGKAGNINRPISCAGVPILPGDIISADSCGIVAIPKDLAEPLARLCESSL